MDKYVIDIDLDDDSSDVLSKIKSLQERQETYTPPKTYYEEDRPKKKNKKDKKEKKKKNKNKGLSDAGYDILESMVGDSHDKFIDDLLNRQFNDEEETDDGIYVDIEELMSDDDDYDSISPSIIDEQRRGYSRLKKEDNPYKKEFAEELTLLYNLLNEVDKFGKKLDKKYEVMDGAKARGISKYTTDMINSILTCKQNKLNIMKEIAGLKKTIADLKIKEEKGTKAGQDGNNSTEMLAASYLKNIVKYGRHNFVNEIENSSQSFIEEGDEYTSFMSDAIKARSEYRDDEIDRFNREIEQRLDETPYDMRSAEGNAYIKYENSGAKILVKKYIDSGEWEFIALDKNNQYLYDYPIPNKKTVGRMKFSEDGKIATDGMGRSYKVIEVFDE